MIEQLPLLTPDPVRARRVSGLCHEKLTRRRRRVTTAAKPIRPGILMVERAIVAGLCALYLSSAAREVTRLFDR